TQTNAAAAALQALVTNKTPVQKTALQGVAVSVTWDQVIDKIYYGNDPSNPNSVTNQGLGNPANGRTPDIFVVLKPSFIFVGNQNKYQFKRAEHGGFSADDTKVALIMSGGLIPTVYRGSVQTRAVDTTQIAVSALEALGLDPSQLQG